MFRSYFKLGSEWTVWKRYLVISANEFPQISQLTFSQVKTELDKSSTVLIDVREEEELRTDGKIKKSHHLPLGQVESAIQLDDASFKKLYGFDKPDDKQNLIIHCKAGVRAMKIAVLLTQAGYSNVKVYNGILDWISNGGEVEKLK